jgi:hypothetical protein
MICRSISINCLALAMGLSSVVLSSSSRAALVTLNVDAAQSTLSLNGTAFGLSYTPQAPGSLSASWSGTIVGDLTSGVFTFSGGSSITANINPSGPYTTAPNPIGVRPGNYGVTANGEVPPFGIVTVNGVYRDLVLDIAAGTAQNGVALTGGTLRFSAGALDFGAANAAPISVGTSNLVNVSGTNTSALPVSFDGTTLTIPVTFQTTGSNRVENWSGTLVATVPEPSSLGILSLAGLAGCTLLHRRRSASGLL